MERNKLFLGIVILGIFFLSFSTASARVIETIFSEDWESGQGDWGISNSVWQIGKGVRRRYDRNNSRAGQKKKKLRLDAGKTQQKGKIETTAKRFSPTNV